MRYQEERQNHKEITVFGFMTSTVGKKYLMGFSALVWAGFVLSHMAGNLLMFVSPEAYNEYGHAITSGKFIYFVEAILIATFLMHVGLAVRLTLQNRASKPIRYAAAGSRTKGSALASRTMAFHGTVILVFVILHLATFKYGTVYKTQIDGIEMRDLYRLVVEVFHQPGYVAWYCFALVLLGFHLSHGVGSMFQSFGLLHPSYQPAIRKLSFAYGAIVAAGFLAQPIYVYFFAA